MTARPLVPTGHERFTNGRCDKHLKIMFGLGTGTGDQLISEQRQINSAQLSSFRVRIGRPFCCQGAGARSGDGGEFDLGRSE